MEDSPQQVHLLFTESQPFVFSSVSLSLVSSLDEGRGGEAVGLGVGWRGGVGIWKPEVSSPSFSSAKGGSVAGHEARPVWWWWQGTVGRPSVVCSGVN